MRGIEYLRKKLDSKRLRVALRYSYYEMKALMPDFQISTPPSLREFSETLGWCAKAVDTLADRVVFKEFRNDNFGFGDIFAMNNPDVLYDASITGALIGGCSFIYIQPGGTDGFPMMQVVDAGNATGEKDPITGLLTEGYAVLERDDYGHAIKEAYMLRDCTEIYEDGKLVDFVEHRAGYPLLVPVINRPDAVRPFGHSRISRACMSIMDAARRTMKRTEIAAEFYSYPQKYVLGTSEGLVIDKWKATMSSMLNFSKDEDGDSPKVGQFQTMSFEPQLNQLRALAAQFAGETGLTLDDLGYPSDQPSSAEAIKASHENLRLTAAKCQRNFGTGFINAGLVAASLRDKTMYDRKEVYKTTCAWEPIFEPDAAMISGIGDGAIKLNQAIPGYFDTRTLDDMTGVKHE